MARSWKLLTDDEILAQIAAARERAAVEDEPRAEHAYYDAATGRVMVELKGGTVFGFPAEYAQGLRGASAEDLAKVEVTPGGVGLHWEKLDADLLVGSVVRGIFGTRHWMRELGRRGGRARTLAKARAARRNGQKGGRPRKS